MGEQARPGALTGMAELEGQVGVAVSWLLLNSLCVGTVHVCRSWGLWGFRHVSVQTLHTGQSGEQSHGYSQGQAVTSSDMVTTRA